MKVEDYACAGRGKQPNGFGADAARATSDEGDLIVQNECHASHRAKLKHRWKGCRGNWGSIRTQPCFRLAEDCGAGRGSDGPEHARRQKDDGADQFEYAADGDAHHPERQ